ncbi:MAG: 50S ribosomal protein L24 [Nitrospirae bacterium]|nr:50S ribosomal protein L24 [Nitrospirota bacterium]
MPKFESLHVRKNDTVAVMVGKDRGKTGKVLRVVPKRGRVVVEKVNMVKRHTKATQDQPGGIIEKEAPIHVSNVLPYCGRCSRGVRIRHKGLEDGTKVRICAKCGEAIGS